MAALKRLSILNRPLKPEWVLLAASPLLAAALALLASGCALQFKPIPPKTSGTGAASQTTVDPRTVFRFFDDDFVSGGYQYTYPDASKIFIPEESGHASEVALQFNLDATDYSGGSVCLYNLMYDMRPYYSRGALQFWVKGSRGGEIAWVALVDDENRDGKKTVVRLPLNDYGGITNEWRLVSIPLAKFGRKGVVWDAKKRVEEPNVFDWNAVTEFRIEIKKGENSDFRVWADDIFVLRDVFDAQKEVPKEDWDDKVETVAPPLVRSGSGKPLHYLFQDALPEGGFKYTYGGKTAMKVQAGSKEDPGILACYLDNDYSGATLALGQGHNIDLRDGRKGKWGLSFWIKAAPGVHSAYVGLLDSRADGIKAQSKITIGDFGMIDTTWHLIQIPIKRFSGTGMYWDAGKMAEIASDVQWDKINEVRFSINKDENKVAEGSPATLYVDDMAIVDEIPGYVDPDLYWAGFNSTAPDMVLHDFESPADRQWEGAHGAKSTVSFTVDANPGRKGKSLAITYQLVDWCDVMMDYAKNSRPAKQRDWTTHYGLRFSVYTDKAFQGITVQVNDDGNEIFVANIGAVKGWNDILVPFKAFNKFAYYQPPDAVQNGVFDLKSIRKLDFKPSGDGTRGSYRIDDVTLTNLRDVPKAVVAARKDVKVEGDLAKTVTAHINDGLFGINTALWDNDLLDSHTATYIKGVNHRVLRYPGGLRADDDHWKDVLSKKDFLVDTDEFLELCKETGNEAMFTVNFGKGTPQEAADWVAYVNKKKGAKVRLWEVGNEIYGDWHPQHTTGVDYGKRAAEFIKAMKAVDPTILVAVVWVIDGEWNKQVMEATKDLADGVIVHHYPQHSGEENDQALLAAPQSLNEIIPGVRKQLKEYGTPGKSYQIWLTEWNSVDFKPGPQTLGLVNGLFVADYLGMLARYNIDQADYWDVHNNFTEQGGDYGYLSRSGAQDGDNVPRPSYHAFKLASESLRGRLAECKVKSAAGEEESQVTCYLSEKPDGGKDLLLVNKYPATEANLTLAIPGFKGGATIRKLDASNQKTGPNQGEHLEIKEGQRLSLPARSMLTLSLP